MTFNLLWSVSRKQYGSRPKTRWSTCEWRRACTACNNWTRRAVFIRSTSLFNPTDTTPPMPNAGSPRSMPFWESKMYFYRFLLAATLLAALSCLADNRADWLPITQEDLQIKEVPKKPGAAAVQLFYEEYSDDGGGSKFFYHRIKGLTDKGKQFADVEIPLLDGFSVADLKARTVHPDGKIIDFTDKPFDTTLVKARGIRIHAKKFTLPDVTVGSIVEYKYRITWPSHVVYDTLWVLQQDLFTIKEVFRIKPYKGPLDIEGARQSYAYLK